MNFKSAYQKTPNQIVCLDPADGTEQWRGTVDLDLEHQLPAVAGNLLLGYPTTTAYANMPIHHPVADGRLVMKGHDGLYTFDLRAK